MNIYIDESGIFANPHGRPQALSCVGALVIPSAIVDKVLEAFSDLRDRWLGSVAEMKGSDLDEPQVAAVVELLNRHDTIFKVAAIDLALHTPSDIALWRQEQQEEVTRNLTDKMHPQLISDVKRLRSAMERLSDPLCVQAELSTLVVDDTIRDSTLYYCQRAPKELAAFHWAIDAKDRKLTKYERLWREVVMPFLQSESLREAHPKLIEGDYSHFERFCAVKDKAPDHLRHAVHDPDKPFHFVDLKMIMRESMRFVQSHKDPGVQLADILVTSFRRALDGTLGEEGWQNLGSLMILKRTQTVQFIALRPRSKAQPGVARCTVPYAGILKRIASSAKEMISRDFEKRVEASQRDDGN